MAKSFSVQMQEILDEVQNDTRAAIEQALEKTPKAMSKELRSTSPRNTGDYAKGWTVEKGDKLSRTVYNKNAPGLTHLLENGHVISNKRGKFGRAPAHKHIEPATDKYTDEFVREIENSL